MIPVIALFQDIDDAIAAERVIRLAAFCACARAARLLDGAPRAASIAAFEVPIVAIFARFVGAIATITATGAAANRYAILNIS